MSTNEKNIKINTIIHWFRKGLRIHDNPALIDAIAHLNNKSTNLFVLRPIFILDPGIIKWLRVGPNRWRFLQQSLQQLDENLRSINSRLYVIRGNPVDVFPILFSKWHVTHFTFESDIEPYAVQRDLEVEKLAKKYSVLCVKKISHTIYDPYQVLEKNSGKPPMKYSSFMKIIEGIKTPEPVERPEPLPNNTKPEKDFVEIKNPSCYDCPTLDELKVDRNELGPLLYPGGETEALKRMKRVFRNVEWVATFEKPNTSPNSLEPSTTVLSPYLKFGCLSSRYLLKELNQVLLKYNKIKSKPPVSLLGQLMWREFFYTAAASEPNFNRMKGNSICRQIPWETNSDLLNAWSYGQTGYPFIDAVMRQLRQEGWIHHLARHAVACFLTRGDLWISWEEGQNVFEELLLDADWALNAGNWMWLSCSAFFYTYFRVYSPVAFGKKTDPTGSYIRKYVPELKKFPDSKIYEPWTVPLVDQKRYGCVLGINYPHRICIHDVVCKINKEKMANAYKKHNLGINDKTPSDNKRFHSKIKTKKEEPSTSSSLSPDSSLTLGTIPLKKLKINKKNVKIKTEELTDSQSE